MSIIKDTFFGGAEKKAAKAQQKGIESGIQATKEGTAQARKDIGQLFPQARQDLQQGFQGALDVFGQSLPAQTQAFQQGNVNAQNTLLAGLPQFQNAILGGQLDFSQLQPQSVNVDTGFFQQQLPTTSVDGVSPNASGSLLGGVFPVGTQFQGPLQNSPMANPFSANTQAPQPVNINAGADINSFRRGPFGQNIGGF